MRIGIMTMWNAIDNYGGILQTYALQRYLRDQGHMAYDIRFSKIDGKHIRTKLLIKSILRFLHIFLRDVDKAEHLAERRRFKEFRNKYICLSEYSYTCLSDLQRNPPKADLYITGSDQVWARSLKKSINERAWYLDFGSKKKKRAAYAVSFGHSHCPVEDDELFKKLVSRFSAVSVREQNGIKFCSERGIKAELCIDSTFLLSEEHYKDIASSRKYNIPYAFLYLLNVETPEEINFEEVSLELKKRKYLPVCTTASGYNPAKEIYANVIYDYATVEEWLANILFSDIVLTTSFHGVAFSLIFRKQFIYMPLKKNGSGNDRVYDLLEHVHLSDRIATPGGISKLLSDTIDYNNLYLNEINALKKQSIDFLRNLTI